MGEGAVLGKNNKVNCCITKDNDRKAMSKTNRANFAAALLKLCFR